MRLAAMSIAYNEERLIRGCIESFKPFVERHIVMLSEIPYYGVPEPMDLTRDIAESLGAEVVSGVWKKEHEQRNLGLILLKDYDWILVSDADMWFTKETAEGLIRFLEKTKVGAVVMAQKAYWYDIDHALINDDFKPVVAVRPNVRFVDIGCVDTQWVVADGRLDHINWCKPKDILKKVTTYSHSIEFNGESWFYRHFKDWNGGKAIMPDGKEFDVEYSPLSEELRCHLR